MNWDIRISIVQNHYTVCSLQHLMSVRWTMVAVNTSVLTLSAHLNVPAGMDMF